MNVKNIIPHHLGNVCETLHFLPFKRQNKTTDNKLTRLSVSLKLELLVLFKKDRIKISSKRN